MEDVLVWQIPYQMESAGMVGYIAAKRAMMLDFQFMMLRRGRELERLTSLRELPLRALYCSTETVSFEGYCTSCAVVAYRIVGTSITATVDSCCRGLVLRARIVQTFKAVLVRKMGSSKRLDVVHCR